MERLRRNTDFVRVYEKGKYSADRSGCPELDFLSVKRLGKVLLETWSKEGFELLCRS